MSSRKFEVGDLVRIGFSDTPDRVRGEKATVEEPDEYTGALEVRVAVEGKGSYYLDESLLSALASSDNDPVSPNHYRFPGGAEVIQISEHLTSNGGQAVQYVARATRLDGQIKGNAVEDLEKALFFIQREIDRLKESK